MIIYEAYNTKNGKSYIGLTTKTLEHRRLQHLRSAKGKSKTHFHKALRKHGSGVFEWSEVMRCSSLESLYKLEVLIIGLFEDWQIYNKSLGGEHPAFGMTHTTEVKNLCKYHALRRWNSRRAGDRWPEECFSLNAYKEAYRGYKIPKTTWYREKKRRKDLT